MIINDKISLKTTHLEALKRMDEIKRKLLFVLDGDIFLGVVSIGDIQRAIINQTDINEPIQKTLRKHITAASVDQSFDEIKKIMIEKRAEAMPIINNEGKLEKIIYWEDIVEESILIKPPELNLPVVIMAGGKGTRLRPITNVIPKPLVPIGDITIVEEIMNRFKNYGSSNFYMSVNYKAELIEYYFKNESKQKYDITYFKEDKPLGTAGSLHLLKDQLKTTFFVSNCDIIVEDDYSEILRYHRENKNELTLVAALKTYNIPYGTIETVENGLLGSLNEKPTLTIMINAGFYILEPHLINEIPADSFFHITELIEKLRTKNRRVGVFPISENSWKDMGEWNDYLKLING